MLKNLFKRLTEPLLLRVDFTHPCWAASAWQARAWLAGAVAADLSAQTLVGNPTWMTVLASLVTPLVFWTAPARLSGAVGGLYIVQALGSVGVVTAVALGGTFATAEVAALAWWGWCMFALVKLILAYIRTPKALLS